MLPDRRVRAEPGALERSDSGHVWWFALAVALVLASAPASAGVLSEDALEGRSTEAGVDARTNIFVLAGGMLEPPFSPEDINPFGVGSGSLRLYFAHKTPAWSLVMHNRLAVDVRSAAGIGGMPIGSGLTPARWLPLSFDETSETVTLRSEVDWLYLSHVRGPATITIGRQPISFGRSKIWSPYDIISTFALTEVDTEYKPGSDAARVDLSLGSSTEATALVVVGEFEEDHDFAAERRGTAATLRVKHGEQWGQAGVFGGFIRNDFVLGVDAVLDRDSFELYTEATLTVTTDASLTTTGTAVRATAGATLKPLSHVTVSPEIYYNGFGETDPDDYGAVAVSERVAIGEQVAFGQFYAGVAGEWEAHPLVRIGFATLVNPLDPSALATVSLHYNLAANAEAVLGGYVPIGKLGDSPGQLASEFGSYPNFVFFSLKGKL